MIFIIMMLLMTVAIASTAAFFSIWGLGEIFSGSFLAVIIMGAVLEGGKLVSASFLYRYWDRISVLMKTYLFLAIIVLMVITSMGIFGKLSYSYQKDVFSLHNTKQQIEILTDQIAELKQLRSELLDRKRQIDSDISSLPHNYVTGRQRLMESYGDEIAQLQANIESFNQQIKEKTAQLHDLKQHILSEQLHVGPIVYIAKVLGQEVDDATKWLIFMIIFAFDPLAIILTVGTNIAITEYQQRKRKEDDPQLEAVHDQPEQPDPMTDTPSIDSNSGFNNSDVERLKKMLDDLNHRDLTPEEKMQQVALEEMLNRKVIKSFIRKNNSSGE